MADNKTGKKKKINKIDGDLRGGVNYEQKSGSCQKKEKISSEISENVF